MARIRTIKPEFFQDEKLAPCDPITRLVFLGLISMADDCGRVLDNVRVIDAFVFPETEDSSREALARLSRMGRIRRGRTASGQKVVQIVNWETHQRVDHPNRSAALPEIVVEEEDASIREPLANDSRMIREPLAHHTNDLRPTTNDLRPVPTTDDRRPKATSERHVDRSVDRAEPMASVYRDQESELRAAGLTHENLALDLLMRDHPHPWAIVLELHSFASGLKVIRGERTGRPADAADVMRAVAEMASNAAPWSTKLFRGYLRRVADRPPEPPSAEEREAAKMAAEVARQAETAKIAGVIVDTRTEAEREAAAQRRADAMARFKAMYRGHNPDEEAA